MKRAQTAKSWRNCSPAGAVGTASSRCYALAQFDQQIRTEGTRTDSSFANATIRRRDVKESEQPTHVREHAIVDYAQVLDQLRAALTALVVELEEPKRTLPGISCRCVARGVLRE
jgi:hypothetical protein